MVPAHLPWRTVAIIGAAVLCGCGKAERSLPKQGASATTTADETAVVAEPVAPTPLRFDFAGEQGKNGVPLPWVATVSAGALDVQVEAGEAERGKTIRLRSEQASFLLRNHQEFNPAEYRLLRWSWKATVLPNGGDVRKNALLLGGNRNDQAVQVLVAFEGNKVLSFVWDTTAPVDTEVDEPSPFATVKTRVLDSGTEHLNAWRQHEIDIFDEYTRRFGEPPRRALGVVVQSNANHTKSIGEGLVGPIEVARRPAR
jgi:hypothetical protein